MISVQRFRDGVGEIDDDRNVFSERCAGSRFNLFPAYKD
jgi:hypothetical protein